MKSIIENILIKFDWIFKTWNKIERVIFSFPKQRYDKNGKRIKNFYEDWNKNFYKNEETYEEPVKSDTSKFNHWMKS